MISLAIFAHESGDFLLKSFAYSGPYACGEMRRFQYILLNRIVTFRKGGKETVHCLTVG